MALLYPSVDFSKSPVIEKSGDYAERRVLDSLKSLDDSWHIFHDAGWRSLGKFGEHNGEFDLIISHPLMGILFLEVKGGGVKLEAGTWYCQDPLTGATRAALKMSPVERAHRSRRSR